MIHKMQQAIRSKRKRQLIKPTKNQIRVNIDVAPAVFSPNTHIHRQKSSSSISKEFSMLTIFHERDCHRLSFVHFPIR